MHLDWETTLDDEENMTFEASLRTGDFGDVSTFRVTPILRRNEVVWEIGGSDMELLADEDFDRRFPTADEARAFCESRTEA